MLTHTSPHTPIEVLLVDDHPAVRVGARKLIDDQPDMRVVAEARSFSEALSELARPIDVAVVDYQLGRGGDGLSLVAQLKRSRVAPRVLVYSAFADTALAVGAILAGADGLLGKQELGEELCHAIRRLARGRHRLPTIPQPVAQAMGCGLEARDQAILGMLLHGTEPDAIAAQLGITPAELRVRRSTMLHSLKPTASSPAGLPDRARAPLDYERPGRRFSRSAA